MPNQIAAIPISARRIGSPVRRVTEASLVGGENAFGPADAHAPPLTIESEHVDDGRRRRFECRMPAGRVRFVEEPTYTIKALDRSTWTAFATLVERNNGIFGGCWCIGFHPEGVDRSGQGEVNRVRSGTTHAALVFDGVGCVGWCQFGSPDEVPRIKNRAAYEKSQTTSPDWRIACCYVGRGHRRQGVATAALAGALDLIAALGGGTVEGYPEDAGAVPAGFLFHGAASTYEKLGFVRVRKIGKHRWVMTREVDPAS